jgi:hypothetical protein
LSIASKSDINNLRFVKNKLQNLGLGWVKGFAQIAKATEELTNVGYQLYYILPINYLLLNNLSK